MKDGIKSYLLVRYAARSVLSVATSTGTGQAGKGPRSYELLAIRIRCRSTCWCDSLANVLSDVSCMPVIEC